MTRYLSLDIEYLPDGWYLGTSDDVPGLVVQEKTVAEVVETALDLTPTLLEWHEGTPPGDIRFLKHIRRLEPIAAE